MTHRRADVYLAPTEARCVPSRPCPRQWSCGRYLAPIPSRGGRVEDYMRQPSQATWVVIPCTEWRAIGRQPASALQRRVHPPIGSE